MQQTVMTPNHEEFNGGLSPPMQTPVEPQSPDDLPIESITLNGVDVDGEPAPEPIPAKIAKPAPTYDELFPALPGGGTGGSSGGGQTSSWGNENMRVQSSNIMTVFHVAHEKVAQMNQSNFGESTAHAICTDITKTTGARIEMSMAKDNSLSFIVSGKVDAVPVAKKLILEKFQTQSSRTIQVPKDHHKLVLGKKGKRLADLEELTGTKISVPNANDPSELITIVGGKDGIEHAVNDITSRSSEQMKHSMDSLVVPKMYHPFITGGGNATINALHEEHGVRINIPPPSVQKDEITIIGEKEAVAKVKEILLTTYQAMEKNCSTIPVEVSKAQHKYVVGQKGANIAEILTLYNVSVEVPTQESESNTITLRGPPEKLGFALNAVYEKAHSQVTEDVSAPMWLHRYIIGKKGANINKITEEFPLVHIEMDDGAERIKLEGPRTEVNKVRAKLESMIEDLLLRIKQVTIQVETKFHKHIIGKSGANINRIRNESNVYINFEENCIKLEGPPDALDAVKEELTDSIRKLENEKEKDVTIDSRLHGQIIGNKGEKIREIRDQFTQVQINFPDPGHKSDVVKVRGPKDEVDACAKHLQKLAKTMLENNFQIKVPIFSQYLKFVIGKGGANINRIRQETDVRIDINASNTESQDEIVLTGKKENCEKAQAQIKEIESEMANITELEIIIPAKFHNSIIGQGGRLIRSISEECGGVSIHFPTAAKKSDKVCIRGPKEEVMKAKKILVEMSNEKQLASFTAEVKCPLQHHKFLIGKNGASIRKMNEETGARIMFPGDKDDNKETITIMGKKDQVANAKKKLEEAIAQFENTKEMSINVPVQHHIHFVSRRAEVLRQLGDEFGGVRVSFPKNGSGSDVVTLKGAVDCVDGAAKRIQEIVADLDAQVSVDVFIPQYHHRTVMGPRGANVQDIQSRYTVKIKFPDRSEEPPTSDPIAEEDASPCDFVRVSGTAEKCEAVKQELLALVPITEIFEVPFRFHSNIIGQSGSHIRSLMSKHGVNVQLPPAIQKSDQVKIVGLRDRVADARLDIEAKVASVEKDELDRVARQFQLAVHVDPQFHPKLIGKKGATISKIRDKYGVNIRIPDRRNDDQTQVTIIGYEDKCKEARDAILEITGDFENQVKIEVVVDNNFHARLIGQRGRNIRKVMEKYKVVIAFPSTKENEEEEPKPNAENIITITGAEANCLECQDHILNQVEEFQQEIDERQERDEFFNSYHAPRPMDLGSAMDVRHKHHNNRDEQEPQSEEQEPAPPGTEETPPHAHEEVQQPQQQERQQPQQHGRGGKKKGFVVEGAPWTQDAPNMMSAADFPSMGASAGAHTPSLSAWGPKRG